MDEERELMQEPIGGCGGKGEPDCPAQPCAVEAPITPDPAPEPEIPLDSEE